MEKAFEYAEKSGRSDWLLFLLSHWDLEKILSGINVPDGDQQPIEPIEDGIPTLPHGNEQKHDMGLHLKGNVMTLLTTIDIYKNLRKYTEGLRIRFTSNDDLVSNFTKLWFPLIMEVSISFAEILKREEHKKTLRPWIGYPDYTWGYNYIKYKRFVLFIVDEIIAVISTFENNFTFSLKQEGFITNVNQWFDVHTTKTLEDLQKINKFLLLQKKLKLISDKLHTCRARV